LIGYEIYGRDYHKHMDIIVYGDDTYIGLNNIKDLNLINKIANDKFGFKIDDVLENAYPGKHLISNFNKENPDFLKRIIGYDGVSWNITKIMDKLFYQSKNRSINDQFLLLINFIKTAPCDDEFNASALKFMNFLYLKYHNVLSVEVKNFLNSPEIDTFRFMHPTNVMEDNFGSLNVEFELANINIEILKESHFSKYVTVSDEDVRAVYYMTGNNNIFNHYKKIFLYSLSTAKKLIVSTVQQGRLKSLDFGNNFCIVLRSRPP